MEPASEDAVAIGAIVGLFIAIALTDLVVTRLEPDHWDMVIRAAILSGFLGWARGLGGLSWAELGFGRAHVRSGLAVGAVAFVIVAAAIAILVAIPASRSYFEPHDIATASTSERILEPLVLIPLGTVVFEETIFRGVLLGALLRGRSRARAVAITSIGFGLWHIPPALSNAHGKSAIAAFGVVAGTIAITTVAGVLFALLRLRSGSILAPMLAHVATNSVAYVASIIALQF
jgi:membrane protease YdiL (CAAX protease family)